MKENPNKSIENEDLLTAEQNAFAADKVDIRPEGESDDKYGTRTVFIAGEDYDENKPFLQEGFNEKKAKRLEKRRKKKKISSFKKQRNFLFGLGTAIIALAIACVFVINYVNTIIYIDEADGTKYYLKLKDNPDYNKDDETSKKKLYYLCDKEGFTLGVTPDGYYSTEAGTLVEVDPETGEYETIAVVDTEGNEMIGLNRRVLMFPHTPMSDIQSIEVHNSEGSYTFYKDSSGEFLIKGHDSVSFDKELFSSLAVSTGYTLTMLKIADPPENETYGLIPEIRTGVDEDGNEYEYQYEPAWYILTDTKGVKHKVIVGDMLVTEGGYYVRYVELQKDENGNYITDENGEYVGKEREAVYVVNTTIADTVLVPIEELALPLVIYPMSLNDYFDVELFELTSYDYSKYFETNDEKDIVEKTEVAFSFIPLDDRLNTEQHSKPYIPSGDFLGGNFDINDLNIDAVLSSLYDLKYLRVAEVGITEGTLKRYGLDTPHYMISFLHNSSDDETGKVTKIPNLLLISAKTENNTYFAASPYYDMVVEIDASQLLFLDFSPIEWVDVDILSLNIAFCTGIKVESEEFNIFFDFDNSNSDQSDGISSEFLEVTLKQDGTPDKTYYSAFEITDTKGFTWKVDCEDLTAFDSKGNEVSIKDSYKTYNKYGEVVRVVDGWITDAAGNSLSVGADTITLKDAKGNTTTYGRSDLQNFRQFYKTLLYGSISGEITTEATPEEIEAIKSQDDSECMLKLTVTTESGRELVYRFYRLTERKALLTINGEGNFFVLSSFVEKVISDAQKAVTGELIISDSKT